jgi:hypothetical protein
MTLSLGEPHRDYSSKKGRLIVDEIFAGFMGFHRGDPIRIARKYCVPARTVREWHAHWMRDPTWRPWDKMLRRSSHQTFTSEEEIEIAQRIRDEIAIPGTLFTDSDFQALAMEEFLARYWREDED